MTVTAMSPASATTATSRRRCFCAKRCIREASIWSKSTVSGFLKITRILSLVTRPGCYSRCHARDRPVLAAGSAVGFLVLGSVGAGGARSARAGGHARQLGGCADRAMEVLARRLALGERLAGVGTARV